MSQVIHHKHSSKNQGIRTASARSFPGNDIKADCCFKMCCSSYLKRTKKPAMLRTVDAVVSKGSLLHQMKEMSCLLPFIIRQCPAVPSPKNWWKPVWPSYIHLLSIEVWPEVVVVEKLQPKSHTSVVETRLSNYASEPRNCLQWSMVEVLCKCGAAFLHV